MLHWPPHRIPHMPLADMAEAYDAYHRYHPKPDTTLAPQPLPKHFLAEMTARFPDTERR